MRALAFLLCLLSAQVWAEVQTLYVRTVADCAANRQLAPRMTRGGRLPAVDG